MRCLVSYYIKLKGRQARVITFGSSSTIRYYRRSLLSTRASLAILNMVSNPRIELGRYQGGPLPKELLSSLISAFGTIASRHVKCLYQSRILPSKLSCFG